eukprot:gene10957-11111_t
MDELHAESLKEIALEGRRGCSLSTLWQLLAVQLPVSGITQITPALQQHLWRLLRSVEISGLQFTTQELQEAAKIALQATEAQGKKKKKTAAVQEAAQLAQQFFLEPAAVPEDVQTADAAGLLLVASEAARLSVLGVYDEVEAANKLSDHQLAVLEMAGQRRHHGAVQTDMANELGVQHRNFFYVLKMLEARHLVVRNKLMVPSGKGSNNGWWLTSIVHLPRFEPRVALGSEAVFKEVVTADGRQTELQLQGGAADEGAGGSSGSYVVRDDATVMQQICDFLGSQSGKYVSETQVKAVLGFTGTPAAHRQWRRLRTRLCKLGCISAEPGMLGDKAISVLKFIKPYTLRLPVVVDSDVEDEEAVADEGAEEEEGEKEGGGNEVEEGEGAGGSGGAAGANDRTAVEVSREQRMIEVICEAGEEGIVSPEISRILGLPSKLLQRGLPDLVKRYGLQVDYDIAGRALTNRIVAPPHLLEKYRKQRELFHTALPTPVEPDVRVVHTEQKQGMMAETTAGGTGALSDQPLTAAASNQPVAEATADPGSAGSLSACQQDAADMDLDAVLNRHLAAAAASAATAQPPPPAAAAAAATRPSASRRLGAGIVQAEPPDIAANAGPAGKRGPRGFAGPAAAGGLGISRPHQKRIEALTNRLQEKGFFIKQEMRRLIVNAETPSQKKLYDSHGPDPKTCGRVLEYMLQAGLGKLVTLQVSQEMLQEQKKIEVVLRPDLDTTPELLREIALYDMNLPTTLRRDGMRRALEAQGAAAWPWQRKLSQGKKAAGRETHQEEKKAASGGGRAGRCAEVFRLLFHSFNCITSDSLACGTAAAAGEGDTLEGQDAEDAKQQERLRAGSSFDALPAAAELARAAGLISARKGEGGQGVTRLHRNGYIPSAMLRVKLLHEYLCRTVNLAVSPSEDFPAAAQPQKRTGVSIVQSGVSSNSRPGGRSRPRFLLATTSPEQQPAVVAAAAAAEGLAGPAVALSAVDTEEVVEPGAIFLLSRPMTAAPKGQTAVVGSRAGIAVAPAKQAGTQGQRQQTLEQLLQQQAGDDEGTAADSVAGAGSASGGNAATSAGGDDEVQDQATQQQQLEEELFEQQLGGRLLSVKDLWFNMPLTVALQVAGTSAKVSNLLQLVWETQPPPTLADFEQPELDAVFGARGWKRVVTALGVLTKLKLLTPAKRRLDGAGAGGRSWASRDIWTQCNPSGATHLVVGTLGVLEVPGGQEHPPPRLSFDFCQEQQWDHYWERMQALFDGRVLPMDRLQKFFPASSVPDITRHRCWVSYRAMPVVPWLRLQSRLEGLPVVQLDRHMAQNVAEELGLEYRLVLPIVTRTRAEMNEARERAGQKKVYLVQGFQSGSAEEEEAEEEESVNPAASNDRMKQFQVRMQRKRQMRRQREMERKLAAMSGGLLQVPTRRRRTGRRAKGAVSARAGDDSVPADEPLEGSSAEEDLADQDAAATAAGSDQEQAGEDGGWEDVTEDVDQEGEDEDELQLLLRAPQSSHTLPKIMFEMDEEDRPPAAGAGGSAVLEDDDEPDSDGIVSDGAMPSRIAARVYKRHRWRPQQDRHLLKWIVAQRVELGTRGSVKWRHNAGRLPLRLEICMRRFNFLKKNRSSRLFLASLEAQASEIHKEFVMRRTAGNIVLLPTAVIQAKIDQLMSQIKEFTTPRFITGPKPPGAAKPSAAAKDGVDRAGLPLRAAHRRSGRSLVDSDGARPRRSGRHSGASGSEGDGRSSGVELSSAESEDEYEWRARGSTAGGGSSRSAAAPQQQRQRGSRQIEGGLPPDASLALKLRFSDGLLGFDSLVQRWELNVAAACGVGVRCLQDEVAAAFKWLRALGWLNAGAARRGFQLSSSWLKRLRGDERRWGAGPWAAAAELPANWRFEKWRLWGAIRAEHGGCTTPEACSSTPGAAAAVAGGDDGHDGGQVVVRLSPEGGRSGSPAARDGSSTAAPLTAADDSRKRSHHMTADDNVTLPVAAAAAGTAVPEVVGYQAVAVGQDKQQRKEAEQACLTAAAAQSSPADRTEVDPAASHSQRPSKRLRQHLSQTLAAMQDATARSATWLTGGSSVLPGAHFVSYLLSFIRAAGALGVTEKQDKVWMSAEDSQRMLAWPIPKQQQQQRRQGACPVPSAEHGAAQQDVTEGPVAAAAPQSHEASDVAAIPAVFGSRQAAANDDEVPAAPWLDHKGCLNRGLWQELVKRVMGVVLRNPGIPEPLLLAELDVVTPAAAAELLGVLVEQGHLLCRTVPKGPTGVGGAGGWVRMGGFAAVRLGAGISSCTPAPALPPSLLIKRQPAATTAAAPEGDRQETAADQLASAGGSKGAKDGDGAAARHGTDDRLTEMPQGRVDVLHYWVSLATSTTCHLTCVPLSRGEVSI